LLTIGEEVNELPQSGISLEVLENKDMYLAWPGYVRTKVQIRWSVPTTHDVLFSGLVDDDGTAYFYAVVARVKRSGWKTFYSGKVFGQAASQRHRAADHVARLAELKAVHPDLNFHLTLGTPLFDSGRKDAETIDAIEGLLIYSNYDEGRFVNKNKIGRSSAGGSSSSRTWASANMFAGTRRMESSTVLIEAAYVPGGTLPAFGLPGPHIPGSATRRSRGRASCSCAWSGACHRHAGLQP
jgi:hypothetical protein